MSSTVREVTEDPAYRESAPTTREDCVAASLADGETGGKTLVNLLPCLSGRYRAVRDLWSGGEANVLLTCDTAGREWVVKQYRNVGIAPDEDSLERLLDAKDGLTAQMWGESPERRGVVWLEEVGRDPSTGLFYEVQEFLPGGPLFAGATSTRPAVNRLGAWPVKALADALIEAVAAFHRIVGAHRDVKPENLLIRSADPLILTLADYGLSRQLSDGQTHRDTTRAGTPAYQSPEAAQGRASQAGDWWAVGMIVAEAALGHHPLALPDGSLPNNQQLLTELAQRDVPLAEVTDPRIRLLCEGLLTRDAQRRWRLSQVREWQQGKTPQTSRATQHGGLSERPTRVRSVRFAGRDHSSPEGLAAAFADSPLEAGELLFQRKDPILLEDLRLMLASHGLHEAQSVLDRYRSGAWQPAFLRLLAEIDPQLQPRLAGQDMTPLGAANIAAAVIEAGEQTPAQELALGWVLDHEVWRLWRDLPGMDGAGDAADRLARFALPNAPTGACILGPDGVAWSGRKQKVDQGSRILVDAATVERLGQVGAASRSAWRVLICSGVGSGSARLREVIEENRVPLAGVTWWWNWSRGSQADQVAAVAALPLAWAVATELPKASAELAGQTAAIRAELERAVQLQQAVATHRAALNHEAQTLGVPGGFAGATFIQLDKLQHSPAYVRAEALKMWWPVALFPVVVLIWLFSLVLGLLWSIVAVSALAAIPTYFIVRAVRKDVARFARIRKLAEEVRKLDSDIRVRERRVNRLRADLQKYLKE